MNNVNVQMKCLSGTKRDAMGCIQHIGCPSECSVGTIRPGECTEGLTAKEELIIEIMKVHVDHQSLVGHAHRNDFVTSCQPISKEACGRSYPLA